MLLLFQENWNFFTYGAPTNLPIANDYNVVV